MEQTAKNDEVPVEAYLIGSVNLDFPKDISYVTTGVFTEWREMNVMDFAKTALAEAESFEEVAESSRVQREALDYSKLNDEEKKMYRELQLLETQYDFAKVSCYVVGYATYLIPVVLGLTILGCIAGIFGYFFAKDTEKQAFITGYRLDAWGGFLLYGMLVFSQFALLGHVNKTLAMSESSFIYRLMFTGGMHCLIPTIGLMVIYAVVCLVIDKCVAQKE